jgi:hypothetical protein
MGQIPIAGMKAGGVQGIRPNSVSRLVGSVRGKVADPAVERGVAHLDGDVEHFVEREEDRDLDEDRQAARGGIHLLLLVERHQLLLHALAVVAVFLAQLGHLRRELLHLAHRLVGLVRQREEDAA